MATKFVLNLTIEGTSLDEIDDFLMQAAGQRLKARMEKPPSGPLGEVIVPRAGSFPKSPTSSTSFVVPTVEVEQPAKVETRGRKPGSKNKVKNETHPQEKVNAPTEDAADETENKDENDSGEDAGPDSAVAVPAEESAALTPVPMTDPQWKATIAALTLVNSKKNIDVAKALLAKYKVKKCGELTSANFQQFIDECKVVCES